MDEAGRDYKKGLPQLLDFIHKLLDNPVNKVGNSEVIWETSGSAHAIISRECFICLSAGDLVIRAMYQGKTYQTHLQVSENTSLAGTFCTTTSLVYS